MKRELSADIRCMNKNREKTKPQLRHVNCKQQSHLTHQGLLWRTYPRYQKPERAIACSRHCDEMQRMLMYATFQMLMFSERTAWIAFNVFSQDLGITEVGRDFRRSVCQSPAEAWPALRLDESALYYPLWDIDKDVKHKSLQECHLWYPTCYQLLDWG